VCLVYKLISLSAKILTGESGRRACCNSTWELRCSWRPQASGQVVTGVIKIPLVNFPLEQISRMRPSKDNLPWRISLFLIVTGLVFYVLHFSVRLGIRIHAFKDVKKYRVVEVFLTLRRIFFFPSSVLVTSFINFEDWAHCFSKRSLYRYAPYDNLSGNDVPYIRWTVYTTDRIYDGSPTRL